MYNQPKRIEFLDSIRGIAALSVLLFHSTFFAWPQSFFDFINLPVVNILFDGHAAVVMFFVLSGFVLSHPYLNPQKPRQIFLPTFYLRRITRIWLPWFFTFCISALVVKYLFMDYNTMPPYGRPELRHSWHFPLTLSSALKQMTLMNWPAPVNTPHLVPQDWSLGIELKASILMPLFIFCARGKRAASLILVVISLMIISVHGYFVSFVLGVTLARFCDPIIAKISVIPSYVLGSIFATGIILYESLHIAMDLLKYPESVRGYFWCFSSIGCVLILIVILSNKRAQNILQHRFLTFLGRVSYSIYLLHMLVLICVQPLIVYSLNLIGIIQPVILLPVSLGVNISLTLAMATLMHRFVEVPSIEVGHRLTKVIQGRFLKRQL